jgi:hypothetical protein
MLSDRKSCANLLTSIQPLLPLYATQEKTYLVHKRYIPKSLRTN